MKIFKASQFNSIFTGTASELAKRLSVSRQAIYKAVNTGNSCNNYTIKFSHHKQKAKNKSTRSKLSESIELLKRARLIIDEENSLKSIRGEYANIGMVEDIDRFIKEIK